MSPRVAYWTSAFEPEMEAVAAEVALLRRRFPASIAWGLSRRHWARMSWRRGYCVHPRLHLVFRAATRVLEPMFDLNHIFGSLGDWFYLHRARNRPTVLTVATHTSQVHPSWLDNVDRFVAEYPEARATLQRLGGERKRIDLIFPPVDLERFRPAPAPEGPFTVLFASSPDEEGWLAARGVPLILEAAALRPAVRFRLLWRPWGNSARCVRRWLAEREQPNVELVVERCADMPARYRQAHVTIAPFTEKDRSKPAPNSLVESLASGRPVLTSEVVGLADVVRDGLAGLVSPADGPALAECLDRLKAEWAFYARNARRLAERWFGADQFLRAYEQVYEEVLDRSARTPLLVPALL